MFCLCSKAACVGFVPGEELTQAMGKHWSSVPSGSLQCVELCNEAAFAALVCSWGSMGRECWAGRQLWNGEVCHIQMLCACQQWVKATAKIQVRKCCSLCVEELVVSAGRGVCKAGKAGPQNSQALCPAVVPGAVTAQPGHTFR